MKNGCGDRTIHHVIEMCLAACRDIRHIAGQEVTEFHKCIQFGDVGAVGCRRSVALKTRTL